METDACPYISRDIYLRSKQDADITSKVNDEYKIFKREVESVPVLGMIFKVARESGEMDMINVTHTQLGGGWVCKAGSYAIIIASVGFVVTFVYLHLFHVPSQSTNYLALKIKNLDIFGKVDSALVNVNKKILDHVDIRPKCDYITKDFSDPICAMAYEIVISIRQGKSIAFKITDMAPFGAYGAGMVGLGVYLWQLGLVKFVKDAVDYYCTTKQSGGGKLLNNSYMINLSRVMFGGGGDSNKIDDSILSLIRKISTNFLSQVLIPDVNKNVKSQNGGRKVLSKVNSNAKRRVVPNAK